jgi:hypothetical protein
MGFHRHHVVKCHTCKSRRAMGGSKKAGRFAGAKESGWAFTKVEGGLGMALSGVRPETSVNAGSPSTWPKK